MWDSSLHTVWSIRPVFILQLKPECVLCFWGEYISPYFCLLSFLVPQQRAEEEARLERENRLRLEREEAEVREKGLRREAVVRRREVPGMVAEAYSQLALIAQRHHGAHLWGYPPLLLPPYAVVAWWVQLPRVSISAEHLNCLSELSTRWRQSHVRECLVHARHIQLNYGSLQGNTVPLVILDNGDLASLSLKGCLLSELSTQVRICALGKIITTCGVKVSKPCTMRGWVTCTLAVLAPFTVGWWFNAGISIIIPLFYTLVVALLVYCKFGLTFKEFFNFSSVSITPGAVSILFTLFLV